jgi:hypothetical protein
MSQQRWGVFDPTLDRQHYVRRVLDEYRRAPTTAGRVRPADRHLAERLYDQRVPLDVVLAAFSMAVARRLFRDFQAPPLPSIQSLHYFLPVIDEIRSSRSIDPDYLDYVAWKVDNADQLLAEARELLNRRN